MNRLSIDGQSQNMLISVEMYIFDERALSCLSPYTQPLAQGPGNSRHPLRIYLELWAVPVLDALRGTVQRGKRFSCAYNEREDRLKGQPAHCWFSDAKLSGHISWSPQARQGAEAGRGGGNGCPAPRELFLALCSTSRRLEGCRSQICCWGLLRVRTMPVSSCLEHLNAMQEGEGGGEGCPHGAKSSPATSFPSCVQPLLSSGVIYLICRVGMFQIMKASCDG